jgi:hypothetical protein
MGIDFSRSHRAMNVRQHEETYSAFTKLVASTCALVIFVLIGMAIFLL